MINQKGFTNIVAVIIALVVLASAGAGYVVVKRQKTVAPPTPATESVTDETAGWETYNNYEYEFKFPESFENRFNISTETKEFLNSNQWAESMLQLLEGTELFAEKKIVNQEPVIFFYGHSPVTGITGNQKLLTLLLYNDKTNREISIAFSGFSQETYERDIKTIENIARTFRFTE